MTAWIEVVAGVLTGADGRVLLSRRRLGTHLAGAWEFPGGKCEAGESLEQALRRELHEELGIDAQAFAPLISLPWHYPAKSIRLHVLRVESWSGDASAREGQALRWSRVEDIDADSMPTADRPVLAALRMPSHYLITPPDADKAQIVSNFETALARGERLFLLRLPNCARERVRTMAIELSAHCRDAGAELLIHHDVEMALELGLGVHLCAAQLHKFSQRPIPPSRWLAASCHDANELVQAQRIGVDFATLSPVQTTNSHPQATPMGWQAFARIVSEVALPIYALGGMHPTDIEPARAAGAQGVAGIRAFW